MNGGRNFCDTVRIMANRAKTAFDRDFQSRMRGTELRTAYERSRANIDAIDALIRAINDAREEQSLSKAELARRMGVAPEGVRRLLSAGHPNPTMRTVIAAASALGLKLEAIPS